MSIRSLNELFLHGLQDLYYAQNQVLKAFAQIMDQPIEVSLFDIIEHHVEETEEEIQRLEQIFRALGQEPKGVTCQAILGLIEEGEDVAREVTAENLRDAALLASVQVIEGYETARYGTLLTWADRLGPDAVTAPAELAGLEIADLLQLSLDEGRNQESRLTALAESRLGQYAAA